MKIYVISVMNILMDDLDGYRYRTYMYLFKKYEYKFCNNSSESYQYFSVNYVNLNS